MRRLRFVGLLAALAAVHLAATVYLGLWLMRTASDHWEANAPTTPAQRLGGPLLILSHPLFFAAAAALPRNMPRIIQFVPFVLDSLLWGAAGAWLVGRLRLALGRPS